MLSKRLPHRILACLFAVLILLTLACAPINQLLATPTNTPTPESAGLGVTREEVQTIYERMGYTFTYWPPVDGDPRVGGERLLSMVELIGPPEELVNASFTLSTYEDTNQYTITMPDMFEMIDVITPDWGEGIDWVTDEIVAGGWASRENDYEVETVHKDVRIKLNFSSFGYIRLSFEPVGR